MSCDRCKGLMVLDHFIFMSDDSGHLWLRGWRCVNCGDIEDPGMTRHHRVSPRVIARLWGKVRHGRAPSHAVVALGG